MSIIVNSIAAANIKVILIASRNAMIILVIIMAHHVRVKFLRNACWRAWRIKLAPCILQQQTAYGIMHMLRVLLLVQINACSFKP